jgi:Tol biopolymer transport system component
LSPRFIDTCLPDERRFERDASFSADGRTVVYTTWDDDELSGIWTVPLAGGASTRLALPAGYYATPRYSPDGTRIVYERTGGDALRGFIHGVNTGLYWIP